MNRNFLNIYKYTDKPVQTETNILYMTRVFESGFLMDNEGKPQLMRGFSFPITIGKVHAVHLVSLFKEGRDTQFLELFGFDPEIDGFIGKGFQPTATVFEPVDSYGRFKGHEYRLGDPVSINIQWRSSYYYPNSPHPCFPEKVGIKLDVVKGSLSPLGSTVIPPFDPTILDTVKSEGPDMDEETRLALSYFG